MDPDGQRRPKRRGQQNEPAALAALSKSLLLSPNLGWLTNSLRAAGDMHIRQVRICIASAQRSIMPPEHWHVLATAHRQAGHVFARTLGEIELAKGTAAKPRKPRAA